MTAERAEFVRLGAEGPPLGARQVGLVPGDQVPALALDLPRGLRGQARETVARRQLRDQLGTSEDSLWMRPLDGASEGAAWTRALVADASRIAQWRDRAGPSGRAVLPDYLALPAARDLWTLGGTDQAVTARLGPADGFTAAPAVALALLDAAHAQTPPRAILRMGPLAPQVSAWLAARDIPVHDSAEAVTAAGLEPPHVLGHGELNFDLRRDPQAARARLKAQVLPWRWPVLAGLVAAALWAAAEITATRQLQARTAELDQATRAMVRTHFIPEGPLLDIRVQVANRLAAVRSAGLTGPEDISPLGLLAEAAQVVVAEGAGVDAVTWLRETGLQITVRTADFSAATALSEALRASGMTVAILQSRSGEGAEGVQTDLALSEGAG